MNNLEELNNINELHNKALLEYFHKNKDKIIVMKDMDFQYTNSPGTALIEGGIDTWWHKDIMYGKVIGWRDDEGLKYPIIRAVSIQHFQESIDGKWDKEKAYIKIGNWSGYSTLRILSDEHFGGFIDDESTLPQIILDSIYTDKCDMSHSGGYVISRDQFDNNDRPWSDNEKLYHTESKIISVEEQIAINKQLGRKY